MKTVLTIAGSDCSGGAGIQADLKTILANGCYGMSVITSLTAQNTTGVISIEKVTPGFLADQLDAVLTDITPDAVKIGMVPDAELIEVIARKLSEFKACNIVTDPVMVATSGAVLSDGGSIGKLVESLLPVSSLVTPNIPEAEVLSGITIRSGEDKMEAARIIGDKCGCAVLVKGGHGSAGADDILFEKGEYYEFPSRRIDNPNTHGTGCTLSSAIACNLAKGMRMQEAVQTAKDYVTGAIGAGLDIGRGRGPLDHGYDIKTRYKN